MAITKISSGVIAGNAIIAAGVAENAISSSEIASNAVDTTQINAGAVTSAKLDTNIDIAGTLDVTGVLTADSNVVIAGNLTVNGTTVTNSATNTTIEDALIELGTGTTGTPANDAGIVIERGDSDNAFIGWDESADGFIVGTGSFTGASTGDLTISTAPITTGALTASGLSYPTSDGSANQVLITNGSGTLSFSSLPIDGAVVSNYTATGDGSTVAFDTGINPQNEVNTWVFVGGVYQPKNTYSYSGSTITFSEAPANGEDIDITTGQIAGFDSAESVLGVYQATTTATDTYDTGLTASNENNTFVFLDGVYQPKTSYTFSGSTITFDANTPADMLLEVMATKTLSASAVTTSTIAANAVTSAKIASNAVLARHIAANAITGAEISSSSQITASTFTGALTGDVTGNVTGNLTGTVQTAAQTNITSVGTLSALTVSGDLTVDTNVLYVDSTNNRVGIGTASPASTFNVNGVIRVDNSAATPVRLQLNNTGTNDYASIYADTASAYKGLVLNPNGGNVGIGTTAGSGKLNINSFGNRTRALEVYGHQALFDGGSDTFELIIGDGSSAYMSIQTTDTASKMHIRNFSGNADLVTIVRSSGNVGIGTTSPYFPFNVYGANASNGDAKTTALIFDTTSATTGTGGGIAFGGYVNGTSSEIYHFGNIQGIKENSTANNWASAMLFSTRVDAGNPTERMRITSSGSVGIGTSSPATKLDVVGSLGIRVNEDGSSTKVIGLRSDFAGVGPAVNVSSNHPLLLMTNNTERVRVLSSGGITFNGDTAAANALDDYEEGTFSPTAGGWSGTYSTQTGNYTKIGNVAYMWYRLVANGGTGSFGATWFELTGLPFTLSGSTPVINGWWHIQNATSTSVVHNGYWDRNFPNNATDSGGTSGISNYATSNVSASNNWEMRGCLVVQVS